MCVILASELVRVRWMQSRCNRANLELKKIEKEGKTKKQTYKTGANNLAPAASPRPRRAARVERGKETFLLLLLQTARGTVALDVRGGKVAAGAFGQLVKRGARPVEKKYF